LFEAKISLNDFCKVFDLETTYFEKVRGESETLGGMMIELFARIPNAGEEITFEKFVFKVQSVDLRRVKKVHVKLTSIDTGDDESTN
jgi:CBS domain containing-hemolysin-like protein